MKHSSLRFSAIIAVLSLLTYGSSSGQVERKSIMITAPTNYAIRLQEAFEGKEYNLISMPSIETIVPETNESIDSLLLQIEQYDHIVLSSRRAIDAFADAIHRTKNTTATYRSSRLCAIGKDAEYVLERLGVQANVVPEEPSLMGIAFHIEKYDKLVNNKKIAVLAPEVRGMTEPNIVPDFIAKLKALGAQITRVNAYYTQPADISEGIALLREKKVDCIAFTSGGEIEALLSMLDSPSLLDQVTLACYGKYTADFARKKGLHVDIEGTDYSSFSGFVTAIHHHFSHN